VQGELEPVRAEGVGLDEIGARRDVLEVDRLDGLRIVEVQDVEARVERHAARVEHRAHGAVGEERARLEPLDQRTGISHRVLTWGRAG
jgi:hypothetical protein